MKKRLFAGALALLMIIGLLPVSSMLKKPVEAQAAGTTKVYQVADYTTKVKKNNYIADNQNSTFFKAGENSIASGKVNNIQSLKLNNESDISFEVKGLATVEVTWSVAKDAEAERFNIIDEQGNKYYSQNNNGKIIIQLNIPLLKVAYIRLRV